MKYAPWIHENIKLFKMELFINIFLCLDKTATLLLAALLGCMSVNCVELKISTISHRLISDDLFFILPSSKANLLISSLSSHCFSLLMKGLCPHLPLYSRASTLERPGCQVVCFLFVFFFWRKQVVKCHQPCVQWNAFQETTTTLKP